MLEKPDLTDEKIIACLQNEYGLAVERVIFLPLGADINSAVYCAIAGGGDAYFVKLRSGVFNELIVTIPKYLCDQGIAQIIAPLATIDGKLWTTLDAFKMVLYPFVEGQDGYAVELSESQWVDFGAALKNIHSLVLPIGLAGLIVRETFSNHWREIVNNFLEDVDNRVFIDPVARKTADFLKIKRAEIRKIIRRTEQLALTFQTQTLDLVLCHGDLHAGNILIEARGGIYIVDWDNPILAPRERDLMFIGGAQGFRVPYPYEEEALFYRGYGQTMINPLMMAYYRYERIIEDIAAFGEQLLLSNEGGEDRERSFGYLCSNFLPNNTIEIAYRSDKSR